MKKLLFLIAFACTATNTFSQQSKTITEQITPKTKKITWNQEEISISKYYRKYNTKSSDILFTDSGYYFFAYRPLDTLYREIFYRQYANAKKYRLQKGVRYGDELDDLSGAPITKMQYVQGTHEVAFWCTNQDFKDNGIEIYLEILNGNKQTFLHSFSLEEYAEIVCENPDTLDRNLIHYQSQSYEDMMTAPQREKWNARLSDYARLHPDDQQVRNSLAKSWMDAIDRIRDKITDPQLQAILDSVRSAEVVSLTKADTLPGLRYGFPYPHRFYFIPLEYGEDLDSLSKRYLSRKTNIAYWADPLIVCRNEISWSWLARDKILIHEGTHAVFDGSEVDAKTSEMKMLSEISGGRFDSLILKMVNGAPIFRTTFLPESKANQSIQSDSANLTDRIKVNDSMSVGSDYTEWIDSFHEEFLGLYSINLQGTSFEDHFIEDYFWEDWLEQYVLFVWIDREFNNPNIKKRLKIQAYRACYGL